jgi:hypothetical protein
MDNKQAINSILAAIRNAKGNTKVVCEDGEFMVVGEIISERAAPFKRMLDGTMKEGIERIINFPDRKVRMMKMLMSYLQFASFDPDPVGIVNYFELYELADKYFIDDLKAYISPLLLSCAKSPKHCMKIYESSTLEIFKEFKDKAYETIVKYIPGKIVSFKCNKCKKCAKVIPQCTYCYLRLKIKESGTCENEHAMNFDDLKCKDYIESEYKYFPCDGILTRTIESLMTNVRDDTLAEIFKKYHSE